MERTSQQWREGPIWQCLLNVTPHLLLSSTIVKLFFCLPVVSAMKVGLVPRVPLSKILAIAHTLSAKVDAASLLTVKLSAIVHMEKLDSTVRKVTYFPL